MIPIGHLFEMKHTYDSHGNFKDFIKVKNDSHGVDISKQLTVKKDQRVDPVPSESRLKIKNTNPLKAKIKVRMGVIDQEN